MTTINEQVQAILERANTVKTSAEALKTQLETQWSNSIAYATTHWFDTGYYESNTEFQEDQELSGNNITQWELRPDHRDQYDLWYDNHLFMDTLGTTTITSKTGIIIQAGYDSSQKKEKAPPYSGEQKNFIIDVANNLVIDVVNDFQMSSSNATIDCTLLDVNANVDISGTLTVGGNTTISDRLTVTNRTTLNDGLTVTGDSILLPGSGSGTTEGEFIFDSVSNEVQVYSGGQWNRVWPAYVEFSSNGSVTTVSGARGPIGYTGSAGTNGTNGADGAQGPIGYTGSAGDPVGYTGSRGGTGFTGSAGPAGGYTGSRGVTGYTGSSSRVNVSSTEPSSPQEGDMWFDSDDGLFSVYYNDGDSSQWVVAAGKQGVRGYTGSAAADITVDSNRYDLTAAKPLRLPRMTTTERNAITAVAGDIIWNTTDSQIQYHNGSTWTAL